MKPLIEYIKENELAHKSELVFFGGSFHPWHEGHSECIRLLPQNKTLIVIPDHNPHKKMTPTHEKISSMQEISKELELIPKKTYLFEGFWQMNKVNPTVEWIKELKATFPEIKLSLLLGFDSFKNITTWNHTQTLLSSLASLYIVSRLESSEDKEIFTQKIFEFNDEIEIKFLGHHPFEHISSTKLRNER